MTRWRNAAAVLVTLTGLSGCDGGEGAPDLPLVGPTWRATNIAGLPVLAGTTVNAVFWTEQRVTGTAGCNRYKGGATAEAGGSLAVGVTGWTKLGCEPSSIMTQENKYIATLGSVTGYQIRGNKLRLESSGTPAIDFTSP